MHNNNLAPIMIVEDSDDDYEATERALKKDGGLVHPLLRFENGESAVAYLRREGDYANAEGDAFPALILLDLNMPGGGGREALKKIKGDPVTTKIPVVILTTSDDEGDIESCYSDGANTFIRKPVRMESFVEAVQNLREYWLQLAILPGDAK